MGNVVIIICIIAIVVFLFKNLDESAHKSASSAHSATSKVTASCAPKPAETLEEQNLYYCVSRFIGAISTIREHCSWRSQFQGGCIQITRQENGTYNVGGHYDHDSDYDILNQLQRGSYLNYLGMKYVEDGFSYQLSGIDQRRFSVISIEDKRMFITDQYVVSALIERFGSGIKIDTAWTRSNSTFVSFSFPGSHS